LRDGDWGFAYFPLRAEAGALALALEIEAGTIDVVFQMVLQHWRQADRSALDERALGSFLPAARGDLLFTGTRWGSWLSRSMRWMWSTGWLWA
jgi:hypothetical protein